MSARVAAASTWPAARVAAEAQLAAGKSAVDAVIAGFFAAAGADAGVLFAPTIALVAGGGAGARAFDGRAAQPGRDATRPRGFVDDEVPEAARVAAPRTLPMIALLAARHGRSSLRELAKPGIDAAETAGETGRAALLARVASAGPSAVHNDALAEAVLAIAGATEGGAMSRTDWVDVSSADAPALEIKGETSRALLAPVEWRTPSGAGCAVIACDGRGLFAALAIEPIDGGLALPGTGVTLPANAEPVRRGVTREKPGTPLAMHAPIAIALGPEGAALILALAGGAIDALMPDALFVGAPAEQALALAAQTTAATTAFAVIAASRFARAVSLTTA